jgi:hypothetical protein
MATSASDAAQALKDNKGFVTQSAKQLGISRSQLHRLINKYPTVKEALTDAREEMKDFAESKIYQGINEGNTALIIFYAKTQMKDRGYTEKQEIDQRTTHIEVDLSDLTDDQLKRLAAGEDIAAILANE